MNFLLTKLLEKLKITNVQKLSSDEIETYQSWEQIITEGQEGEKLLENESFKKGVRMAEIRLTDLLTQLLRYNDRDKDISLKSEINNIINTLSIFSTPKRQKEILEEQIKQRLKI